MSVVVRGQGLTKRFGAQLAVAGLDLEVNEGECFGLLGPNGAGKTTTLRMVYGVNQPTSGRIEVFGLDVATHGRAVRGRLGVTLQENVLIDALSPVDNLRVFGRYHLLAEAELERRIARLSERFELGSHAHMPVDRAVGRLQAPARDRDVADQRARAADPRRADHRARPRRAALALEQGARAARRGARPCCSRRTTWTRPSGCATA